VAEPQWAVPAGNWPVGDPHDPDLVAEVLERFDEMHPAAVTSLAATATEEPREDA
jgi:hypothetical protein